MTRLLQIDPNPTPPKPRDCALWQLGFRPFYLLAGLFSVAAIALWVAHYSGWLGSAYLSDPLWHAHEMIFGYALAVIVGFLFTAVRNWTAQPTPSGLSLAAIAALWLAARLLLVASLPLAAAAADVAFAIAAAWGIAVPLVRGGNRRNLFFIAVLLAIGVANLAFHLAMAQILDFSARRMLQSALDLVLFVMVVMGGRVIPAFTANALPQARPSRPEWLERAAPASVLLLLAADLLAAPAPLLAGIAGLAALAQGLRLALWQPWHTLRQPLVWILHAAYAWIAIHLALRAWATFDPAVTGPATHALTVGAIGSLTLGMMTRTTRGHTGLTLIVGSAEIASFLLVNLAAALRVLLPLAAPALTLAAVQGSGALWCAAFVLFLWKYAPILWRSRVDGRPG